MSWTLAERLQLAEPGDPLRDYCQWPYEPIAPLAPGALRSSALLYQSFQYAGASDRMIALVDRLVERAGRFNTVWGVKWAGGRLSWEFYFYDYRRMDRAFGIADFIGAARGLLDVTVPAADDRPYFMFSVEVDGRHLDGEKPVDQIDLYIGNPGSAVSSGICYGLSRAGMELRNFYFFFDAQHHAQDIREKLISNAHIPWPRLRLEEILWPGMQAQTIVIANKRQNDGLYFSRIPVDALRHFLDRLAFPEPIRAFVTSHRAELAHHLWDVGYDYLPGSGGLRLLKGSYYGLL